MFFIAKSREKRSQKTNRHIATNKSTQKKLTQKPKSNNFMN